MFPNLAKLAAIGLFLPMSTTDYERGFFALTRVKTNLCNRSSAKTLNHLLVITTEGLISPTDHFYDQVCDLWASWRNQRIQVETCLFSISLYIIVYTTFAYYHTFNNKFY